MPKYKVGVQANSSIGKIYCGAIIVEAKTITEAKKKACDAYAKFLDEFKEFEAIVCKKVTQ